MANLKQPTLTAMQEFLNQQPVTNLWKQKRRLTYKKPQLTQRQIEDLGSDSNEDFSDDDGAWEESCLGLMGK